MEVVYDGPRPQVLVACENGAHVAVRGTPIDLPDADASRLLETPQWSKPKRRKKADDEVEAATDITPEEE